MGAGLPVTAAVPEEVCVGAGLPVTAAVPEEVCVGAALCVAVPLSAGAEAERVPVADGVATALDEPVAIDDSEGSGVEAEEELGLALGAGVLPRLGLADKLGERLNERGLRVGELVGNGVGVLLCELVGEATTTGKRPRGWL